MVDKEAQERIADFATDLSYNLGFEGGSRIYENYPDHFNEVINRIATRMVRNYGYCKLPEGKPPLLEPDVLVSTAANMEAQRDADYDWYGGK